MVVSPTVTSATWLVRTMLLNSLYEIWRPPGVNKYAWPSARMKSAPRTHQMAVGRAGDVRLFPPEGSIGLGNDNPLFHEGHATRAGVDHHVIAFGELTLENPQRQRIQHATLDRPLQRASPIDWIIPLLHQEFLGAVGELDVDLAVFEALHQPTQLNVDDLLHVVTAERMEV